MARHAKGTRVGSRRVPGILPRSGLDGTYPFFWVRVSKSHKGPSVMSSLIDPRTGTRLEARGVLSSEEFPHGAETQKSVLVSLAVWCLESPTTYLSLRRVYTAVGSLGGLNSGRTRGWRWVLGPEVTGYVCVGQNGGVGRNRDSPIPRVRGAEFESKG